MKPGKLEIHDVDDPFCAAHGAVADLDGSNTVYFGPNQVRPRKRWHLDKDYPRQCRVSSVNSEWSCASGMHALSLG